MIITKITEMDSLTMKFEGWLDTTTSPELAKELESLDSGIRELIFDFEKLEYISSAGLRQIVSAYKLMENGSFKIINASKPVMEVLKMTGFLKKLNVEPIV